MPELIIRIDVYKPSGKWYTGEVVTNEKDIPLHDPAFKTFIDTHMPAHYGEGFVVVTDCANGQGFHNHLFKYDPIKGLVNP